MDISAKHKKAPVTQIKNLVGVLEISRVVEDRINSLVLFASFLLEVTV